MWETWVRSLGWEDPLEKEMATHSSSLAWKIPWIARGAWQATVHGVAKSQTQLSNFTSLQYSIVYIPHLHLFLCLWMYKLLPFLGYCN